MQRALVLLVLCGALTGAAGWQHGDLRLFLLPLQTLAGTQVLVDLVPALGLALVRLVQHARAQGRTPWPWVAIRPLAGSFGPPVYLLTRRPAAG